MKIDKNRKEEYKIARSEERVAARNARKAERRVFRVKQITSEEEVKPKNFYSEELKARRKVKRERAKALIEKRKSTFVFQSINYPKFNKYDRKQLDAQVKFDNMIININQTKARAKKQSKEDKAKYKASLVAFKKTYVRKQVQQRLRQSPKICQQKIHNLEILMRQYAGCLCSLNGKTVK